MRSFIFICVLSIIIFFPATTEACSCNSTGPPCQSYWNTEVVFSGRVIEIKPFESTRGWRQKLVRFAVNQAFRGISETTIEIATGSGGGDCGYDFKLNESYLVYANNLEGKLFAGICTRTQHISKAAEDLEYINNLSKAKTGATVSGVVNKYRKLKSGEEWQPNPPLPNIRLTIEGNGKNFEATTDISGKFSLENLASGNYIVRLLAPDGFYPYKSEQTVKIHEKGCAVIDFSLAADTSVSGRVFDENGAPAAEVKVNLISVEQINERYQKDKHFIYTDEDGRFTFRTIPSGKYYLGFRLDRSGELKAAYPRTFFPGTQNLEEATMITISEGQTLENYNFQLPAKLTGRKIEGIVAFPDGKPVPDARICLEEIEYAEESGCDGGDGKVEANGHFSFTRLNGLRYLIRAHVSNPDGKQRHAEPIEIPANGNIGNLKLVISEPNGRCEKCIQWTRKKN